MEPWLLHLLKRLEAGVLGRRRIWRSPWSSVVQRGHRSLGLGRSALGSSQPKTQAPGVFPGPPQGGLIGRQGPRCAALCKVDKTVGDERTGPQSSRVPGPHSQEQPREAGGWPDPSRHPQNGSIGDSGGLVRPKCDHTDLWKRSSDPLSKGVLVPHCQFSQLCSGRECGLGPGSRALSPALPPG